MCFSNCRPRTVVDERKLVPWAQEVLGQRDDQLNYNVNTEQSQYLSKLNVPYIKLFDTTKFDTRCVLVTQLLQSLTL